VIKHEAYRDCYRYRKAVFDLHEKNYTTNGFVLLSERIASPASLAAINYVRYSDLEDAANFIRSEKDKIQCVVSNILFEDFATVPFGRTQLPEIDDYADGVDTLRFLLSL
jgi:hypothetical protein